METVVDGPASRGTRRRPRSPEAGPNPELPSPFPQGDGWGAAYRLYDACIRPFPFPRALVRGYLRPCRIERAGDGLLFRVVGVPVFGRMVPTGGIAIRRLTGARMAPYTLAGSSLGAAREFFYRACIFEALHLLPMLLLGGLALLRLQQGRPDLALENTLVNLAVNVYPILHHRHTRVRILRLLKRDARRHASTAPGGRPSGPGGAGPG